MPEERIIATKERSEDKTLDLTLPGKNQRKSFDFHRRGQTAEGAD
jgi:hypothetical protein